MIFLLNHERVLVEVMELVRLKIASKLSLEPQKVEIGFTQEEGRLVPQISVKQKPAGALEAQRMQEVIAEVWGLLGRVEMSQRLAGLSEVRGGQKEEQKDSLEPVAQAESGRGEEASRGEDQVH